jgi:cell division protein FtsA
MIQDDYRAAIDIGATKVCAILARKRQDHRVELLGIGVAPNRGMVRGTVNDTEAVSQAVREAVSRAGSESGVTISRAYIGLTGAHLESQHRWSNVPRDPGVRAVTDTDISAALRTASRMEINADRRLLHVIPRSYSLDGIHGVRNPLGMHTGELHIESVVITGSNDHIYNIQEAVRKGGVEPMNMVVEPLSTADAVLTSDEKEDGVVLIDIGGGATDISVFHGGAIIHTDVVPVGGHHFTNDLSIAFSLEFDDAERLKIEKGTCSPDTAAMKEQVTIRPVNFPEPLTITRREVGQVLRDRAQEMFRIVLLKLDTEHLREVPLERVVFTGGGSKLEGLESLARFMFQRKVRLGVPRGLEGLPDVNRDPAYAAAVGITLWGFKNLPKESHVTGSRNGASRSQQAQRGERQGVISSLAGWIGRKGN